MEPLLHTLNIRGGKTITGIVDDSDYRYVRIFDLNQDKTLLLIFLAAIWQANSPSSRFSHYCIKTFPKIKLPSIKLIPRYTIIDTNRPIPEFNRSKRRQKRLELDQSR